MFRCQPKDYDKMLESLYSHTIPLIGTDVLAGEIGDGKNVVLLDTRSEKEYSVSHIRGAGLIDYKSFSDKDVAGLAKDAEIVVYCSVGYRSEKVGEQLRKHGFINVRNLYGGIFQWKNDGFEVVNDQSMPTDSVHTYSRKWSRWLKNGVKVY
jgi:rhodanese-related sulfurtransferase